MSGTTNVSAIKEILKSAKVFHMQSAVTDELQFSTFANKPVEYVLQDLRRRLVSGVVDQLDPQVVVEREPRNRRTVYSTSIVAMSEAELTEMLTRAYVAGMRH